MLYVIILAHLLGDYLFQWGFIARWKARSLLGVLAHGGIVTVTTLACAMLVDPSWQPYAALIGLAHTTIDLVRARFLRTSNPLWELVWYLLDQAAHLAVILLVVAWSGASVVPPVRGQRIGQIVDLSYTLVNTRSAPPWPLFASAANLLTDPRVLTCAIGYLVLLNPAWVFFRFAVRGLWGSDAAPPLGRGEKYGPMVERVMIGFSRKELSWLEISCVR